MNIVVHSKDGCPFCELTKDWLDENGFEFENILHNDDNERKEFYEKCGDGVKSVPQIFLDGIRLGGYDALMANKDELLLTKTNFDEDF